jgi:hypothetical protein
VWNWEGDGSPLASMLRKGEKGGKMVGAPVQRSKGKGEGGGPVGAGECQVEEQGEGSGWPDVEEVGAGRAARK